MTPRSNALWWKVQSARPFGDLLRAAVRVPHDVRCLETERRVGNAQVEVADSAPALVRTQYRVAEVRVSPRAPGE